jgi:hypothetical protein
MLIQTEEGSFVCDAAVVRLHPGEKSERGRETTRLIGANGHALGTVLGDMAEAAEMFATARTGAFRGLIQNLRRLGLPEDGPGRGKAIAYGQDDVDAWLLALQFERFGVPPAGAVKSVKGQWKRLSNFIKKARVAKHGDIVLVVETDFLSPRWTPGLDASITGSFEVRPTGIESFLDFLDRGGCGCIFNLSARLRALDTALEAAQKAESEAP